MGGLLDGGEHVVADVAFVAYPGSRVDSDERFGFREAIGVMVVAVYRVGDPREVSGQGAGELDVHAGGLVLAGVQGRASGP